ncbi:phage holin family protein [Rhodobacteraceae bacterium N5(2021)]|uniref:Phage holin family protein n=1 Tax=Gymnodinialimonas phycosphaerae TaxID=2841589 RepID=A0A975TYJ2_9RHOB|nr:phage holin family protein [Gymnodinialimonas phycosphaerae]MBY4892867.1 phage holin family protein [Gymnodinialimonas phycosphaerae]
MVEPGLSPSAAASLIGDIFSQGVRILRKEASLAKAELSENLGRAGVALGLLVGAVVLALVALVTLAGAGVAGLVAAGWSVWLSALVVGGGLAVIAAIFATIGVRGLKPESLAPSRSIENVKRDFNVIKEQINA